MYQFIDQITKGNPNSIETPDVSEEQITGDIQFL
jgi:hypothetical protein